MRIIKQQGLTLPGTEIRIGNKFRGKINECVNYLTGLGFWEIHIPSICYSDTFKDKVGDENNNMMYRFNDAGGRDICLAPEYTAVVSKLKLDKEEIYFLFYIQKCYRGERQQKGRYREFTQLGVEIVLGENKIEYKNTKEYEDFSIKCASKLISIIDANINFEVNRGIKRGLDYYNNGLGFEIRSKEGVQLCGGGSYNNGIGFAIGFDRCFFYQKLWGQNSK